MLNVPAVVTSASGSRASSAAPAMTDRAAFPVHTTRIRMAGQVS
jgi:hypothetical protein